MAWIQVAQGQIAGYCKESDELSGPHKLKIYLSAGMAVKGLSCTIGSVSLLIN